MPRILPDPGRLPWKLASGWWWTRLAHAMGKPCHIGRISGRERVRLVKSWGADSIDSCVPLWSADNRLQVLRGLADPPMDFDPPDSTWGVITLEYKGNLLERATRRSVPSKFDIITGPNRDARDPGTMATLRDALLDSGFFADQRHKHR